MSINLKKLTPFKSWRPKNWDAVAIAWFRSPEGAEDAEFIRISREAFDVMMRRGWGVQKLHGFWIVGVATMVAFGGPELCAWMQKNARAFTDPFTALTEADRWATENGL